jgi:2-methylcitrate synthase/citrate synthase II
MSAQETPAYSPGLEGVIAGESAICHVDVEAGLSYRGYDVEQLAAHASFEEVAWLLIHGELPTRTELAAFNAQIAADSALPEKLVGVLRLLPTDARTMDVLRSGTSLLSSFDPEVGKIEQDANVRKSTRLLARMTSLVTGSWRILHGEKPFEGGSDVSLAERFLFGLTGQTPPPWRTEALNVLMILYAEHEFNASTFAARVTASTLSDLYAAITSAIGTLEGALHGGANEEAMKMLRDIGRVDAVEGWVKERLARREKIMGFGHRVYKKGDSRVPVTRRVLEKLGTQAGQPQWLEICVKLEEVLQREKRLYANLDLYAAPVLHVLGIPSALNTPLFACARVAGWCAHVIEQQDHNRLIRPRCIYTGPSLRNYVKSER